MQDDPHDLQRFIEAQDRVWNDVKRELAAGAKVGHWMWFVFPQLRGLGFSATAQRYGIASRAEARAYWRHPLLGARLRDCTGLMLAVEGRSARRILGAVDEMKFRSCMTLFEPAAPDEPAFARALDKYFGGERDARTLASLK